MISTMAIDQAQRRVHDFQQRCGEYGEAALHLAYHAALPVALNAELLHLLRINFFLDPPEILPYTVEFEFLLSSLCREIDEGLYEIEPDIRDVLLAGLSQTYPAQRTRDIATLLWQYVDHHSPWSDRMELERAQQLTALNFLNPEKAQQWLVTVETEVSQGQVAAREWFIAMRQDIENQAQHLKDTNTKESQEPSELPTKDFFISYNRHDRQWAEWIAWTLEAAGYSAVLQAWNFRAGGNFVLDMRKAASEAASTIAVLSETYLNSEFTQLEWAAAFAQAPTGNKRKMIPVRVKECQFAGLLASITYIDLVGVPEREARRRLLEALKGQVPEQQILGQVPFPGMAEPSMLEEVEQTSEQSRQLEQQEPVASLRSLTTSEIWQIQGNLIRVGRDQSENDLALRDDQGGISRKHAVIFRRLPQPDGNVETAYFLEDFSRFGTWILEPGSGLNNWRKVHREEVPLSPGTQLKFGSTHHNETLEFLVAEPGAIREQVETLQQFQGSLENGREAAAWLDESRTKLVETVGRLALDQFPDIKEAASPEQVDDYYFSIKQFLEQISHCLIWGRYDILDEPEIPLVFENKVYETAFRKIKKRLPEYLNEDSKEQLINCIDYLVKVLERVDKSIEKEDQNETSPSSEAGLRGSQGTIQNNPQPIQVFISYAYKDEVFYSQLVKHLNVLRRESVISIWHDRCIQAGDEWAKQISTYLESADIILLLISADFVASSYCWDVEVTRAIERHDAGEARLVPILLRPVDLGDSPLSRLQLLPRDGKAITGWGNRDEAFLDVIQGIRQAAEQIMARSQLASNQLPSEQRRRLKKREVELQKQLSLLNRQLQHLRRDYAIETNAAMRLQFQKRIEVIDLEIEQLESSLESLE